MMHGVQVDPKVDASGLGAGEFISSLSVGRYAFAVSGPVKQVSASRP